MKFLIDEVFSPAVTRHLVDLGHDALHVRDVGLSGRTDDEVLDRATAEDRVVVTENSVDFVALLHAATSAGTVTAPVVLALKRTLPTGTCAMAHELAKRLARWADSRPDPNRSRTGGHFDAHCPVQHGDMVRSVAVPPADRGLPRRLA